jgi:hypothetical protein
MVNAIVQYLARDKLYETEKPYSAEFEIDDQSGDVKKTNYFISPQSVTINEIGPSDTFGLDIHGFRILKAKTELRVEVALASPQTVEAAYLEEIKSLLQNHFPEYRRLEGMEFVVSVDLLNIAPIIALRDTLRLENAMSDFPQRSWPLSRMSSLRVLHTATSQLMARCYSSKRHFQAKRNFTNLLNLI